MYKKAIYSLRIIIVLSACFLLISSSALANEELCNLQIYNKDMAGSKSIWEDSWLGYGGACNLDNSNERVKIIPDGDDAALYVSGNIEFKGGWWLLCVARPMWQIATLDEPYTNSYLEFDIKLEGSNKEVLFGIADKSRRKKEALLLLNDYITPTNSWQTVKVPINDFLAAKKSIDLSKISHIIFRNTDSVGDFKLYISNIEFKYPFKEKDFPLIKVNQLGYKPEKRKIAFISGRGIECWDNKEFFVIEADSGKTVFEGRLDKAKEFDEDTGDAIYRADFSRLKEGGSYRLQLKDSNQLSSKFIISENVYNPLLRDSLRMFYLQRCGCAINKPFSKKWQHKACHLNDAFLLTKKKTKIEAAGGWHDAGDYGKYIINGGISVATLLSAYEFMPDKFYDGQLNMPESGNNLPDILDEARYEIEWFMKMQRQDGGVYHKLAGVYEVNWKVPDKDKAKRYIIDISAEEPKGESNYAESIVTTTATANFAAVCAQAARIYKDYDEVFSLKCLNAAEKAWTFLEAHSSDYPPRGFCNPILEDVFIVSGEYGDDPKGEWSQGDADERFWAAAELFRTTSDEKYHDFIKAVYINFKDGHSLNWQQLQNYGLYTYCFSEKADKAIKDDILISLKAYAEDLSATSKKSGYKAALHNYDYYWGSNAVALNHGIDFLYAYKLFGSKEFLSDALNQLHYALGRNTFSYSFISHAGENSVDKFYHMWFMSAHYDEYPPGFLVAGPNCDNYKVSKYPARCYGFNEKDFTINEIAINYNAPLVFVSAFFSEPEKENR
jgi:endoglucanase